MTNDNGRAERSAADAAGLQEYIAAFWQTAAGHTHRQEDALWKVLHIWVMMMMALGLVLDICRIDVFFSKMDKNYYNNK